jgi:hypothetical protein
LARDNSTERGAINGVLRAASRLGVAAAAGRWLATPQACVTAPVEVTQP